MVHTLVDSSCVYGLVLAFCVVNIHYGKNETLMILHSGGISYTKRSCGLMRGDEARQGVLLAYVDTRDGYEYHIKHWQDIIFQTSKVVVN